MSAAFLTWTVLSSMIRVGMASRPFPVHGPESGIVVVLDPGHGGSSKGACNPTTGVCEKTLTLRTARRAKKVLDTLPGVRVVLTRDRDVHVPLYRRADIAETSGAALFVSLHANASPGRDQRGFEAFVYPPMTAFKPFRLGSGARSASTLPRDGLQVTTILGDLRQQSLRNCSVLLARSILNHMTRRMHRGANRGLKQQHLAVLAGLRVPGVLLEIGFIDHPKEGRRILRTSHLQRVARALRAAVSSWMEGPARRGCSPEILSPRRNARNWFAAPADTVPPPRRRWKPKRWKPSSLPGAAPVPGSRRSKSGLLVWST